MVQDPSVWVALAVGISIGLLVGLFNGIVWVAVFEINALIATLATSFVVGGIAALATNGDAITAYDRPGFGELAQSNFLGLTSAAWIALGTAAVLAGLLWASTVGRYIYAVGGNRNAARLAGWQEVTGIHVGTFMLSGAAAALGGLMSASRVLSAQSSNGGDALTSQ